MINTTSYKFKGEDKKLITADLTYGQYKQEVPICVFSHGFKGFKDWGAWPLAAQIFALKGIPFFKFNYSHNGTSPAHPTEFVDLEAFGNNNLKMEYDELGLVLDFIEKKSQDLPFQWNGEFLVLGHSRGGGISLIRTANDPRINKCVTWNGVSDFASYVQLADPEQWRKEGVMYVEYSRTGVPMPVHYQFYESFMQHHGLLNVLEQAENVKQDVLIIQAEDDEVVTPDQADAMYETMGHSIKVVIERADHTFNTAHPLTEKKIPLAFAQAIEETIEFFLM